jgi:hypothetical protein
VRCPKTVQLARAGSAADNCDKLNIAVSEEHTPAVGSVQDEPTDEPRTLSIRVREEPNR